MRVFPSHYDLKHFVEGMKADGSRYDYFPPDRRLNVSQLDVQVVAALGWVASHGRFLFSVLVSSKAERDRKSKTTKSLPVILTLFPVQWKFLPGVSWM